MRGAQKPVYPSRNYKPRLKRSMGGIFAPVGTHAPGATHIHCRRHTHVGLRRGMRLAPVPQLAIRTAPPPPRLVDRESGGTCKAVQTHAPPPTTPSNTHSTPSSFPPPPAPPLPDDCRQPGGWHLAEGAPQIRRAPPPPPPCPQRAGGASHSRPSSIRPLLDRAGEMGTHPFGARNRPDESSYHGFGPHGMLGSHTV